MECCPEMFVDQPRRRCDRPVGHDGVHGNLVTKHHRFDPPRPIADFLGKPGSDVGDLLLSPMALDELAAAKVQHRLPNYVVIGGWSREDGAKWLEYARV